MTHKIEWTDATWNPVRGCTRVSDGCRNCYAERIANRFNVNRHGGAPFLGYAKDGKWTGKVALIPGKLEDPLHWRNPRRVFVNSMSDLFHENLADEAIRRVFGVMSLAGQHAFQVLTKRPERMRAWFASPDNSLSACQAELVASSGSPLLRIRSSRAINGTRRGLGDGNYWPLPNVWLGVSVETQGHEDRISALVRTPAAVRFVSVEPMLRSVRLGSFLYVKAGAGLDWVICGGETGPQHRSMNPDWARALRDECKEADVPFFMKQMAGREPIPADLMLRQFPEVTDV